MIWLNLKGHCLSSPYAQNKLRKAFQTKVFTGAFYKQKILLLTLTALFTSTAKRATFNWWQWNTTVCKGLNTVPATLSTHHLSVIRDPGTGHLMIQWHLRQLLDKFQLSEKSCFILYSPAAERLLEPLRCLTKYQVSWQTSSSCSQSWNTKDQS